MADFRGKGNSTQVDMLATVLAKNDKGVLLDVQLDQSQGGTGKKAVQADVKAGAIQSNAHLVSEKVTSKTDGSTFTAHGKWYSTAQYDALVEAAGGTHTDKGSGREFIGFQGNIGYGNDGKPMVKIPKGVPEGASAEEAAKIEKYNAGAQIGASSHEITDKTLADHSKRTAYAYQLISEQRAASKEAGKEAQGEKGKETQAQTSEPEIGG